MANKHLSEDKIQYTIDVKTAKAQQEIHKLETQTASLRNENKQRLQQMIQMEAAGRKESEQYKKLSTSYRNTSKQIRELTSSIQLQSRSIDTNAMTMSQLRKQSKSLQNELDNVSKALNPQQYSELENRLQIVNARIAQLKQNAKGFKEIACSDQTNSFFISQAALKALEWGVGLIKNMSGAISELIGQGIDMAELADGITHAFRQLDEPGLLNNLRKATKNTVNDVELMKAAVKAKDFHIPLEDLGKYLSFAQLKAKQTGQSLDYMVDSIVTGLGRKSPMILDNLGLSASEISEKTKETGNFMKGVASIVENELSKAGDTYISAADRAAQKTTELQNKQRELGEALLPLKERAADAFGTMKISIMSCIIWLISHKKLTAALTVVITALTISMTLLNTAFKAWVTQTTAAKIVTAAWTSTLTTLKGAYLLVAAAINTMRGNSLRATAQMRLFNLACKSNVILLIVTALVAAGVAFYSFLNKTAQAKRDMVIFNLEHAKIATDIKRQSKDIEKVVNESTASEITKVKTLKQTIHDASKSYNQRKKAILDMQSIVPGYHASITKEGRLFNENTTAIDTYIRNLRRAARAEAAYEQMKANEKQILNAQDTLDDAQGKKKNVNRAGSKRGVKLDAGEHVEKRTQTVGNGSSGAVMTNDYYVVVNSFGKVLREISKEKGELIMKDQVWANMFEARTKVAQDRIEQFTAQNERLEKIVEQNGGIGQKFSQTKHGTTKTHGKHVNSDLVYSRGFSAERSSNIDNAKRTYDADLNILKQALIEKKITQQQYNASTTSLNIQYQNNLLNIEKQHLQKAQELHIKDANRRNQIIQQQQKAVANQQQQVNEAYLEAEKQFYDVLDSMKQIAPTAPQTLQQECDAKLLALNGYYQASLQLAKEDAQRQQQVTADYEAAKAAIIADYAKKTEDEKAHARQEFGLDTFKDQYETQAKKRKEAFDKGVIDKQQYDQAMANLDQQAEEHRLQIRQQYGLATQQELYNAELEQLKQHLQNKEISETEYEEAVKNLKIAKAKEAFDYYSNLTSGAMQALMQAEEANVDAKYDAEIEAAKNAGQDTTELEKKKANEKLKIQKKYADVNFAIQASQIIASTAAAIAKTFSELGFPAGIPAAALMAVTGTAQLAAALAERNKVKKMTMQGAAANSSSGARVATGLESGGSIDIEREQDGKRFHAAYEPNRRGFVDKPTVIVGEGGYGHSKEWVASNAAVENPTISPIIDIIDRAQRAGTIRTLDMNKFILQQASGRAAGGAVSHAGSNGHIQPPDHDASKDMLIRRLTDVLDRLATEGIPASVALNELEQKQQLRDKARRFGSK